MPISSPRAAVVMDIDQIWLRPTSPTIGDHTPHKFPLRNQYGARNWVSIRWDVLIGYSENKPVFTIPVKRFDVRGGDITSARLTYQRRDASDRDGDTQQRTKLAITTIDGETFIRGVELIEHDRPTTRCLIKLISNAFIHWQPEPSRYVTGRRWTAFDGNGKLKCDGWRFRTDRFIRCMLNTLKYKCRFAWFNEASKRVLNISNSHEVTSVQISLILSMTDQIPIRSWLQRYWFSFWLVSSVSYDPYPHTPSSFSPFTLGGDTLNPNRPRAEAALIICVQNHPLVTSTPDWNVVLRNPSRQFLSIYSLWHVPTT